MPPVRHEAVAETRPAPRRVRDGSHRSNSRTGRLGEPLRARPLGEAATSDLDGAAGFDRWSSSRAAGRRAGSRARVPLGCPRGTPSPDPRPHPWPRPAAARTSTSAVPVRRAPAAQPVAGADMPVAGTPLPDDPQRRLRAHRGGRPCARRKRWRRLCGMAVIRAKRRHLVGRGGRRRDGSSDTGARAEWRLLPTVGALVPDPIVEIARGPTSSSWEPRPPTMRPTGSAGCWRR